MTTWRDDLVGKKVLVLDTLITGVVAKVYGPNEYLRADADPDEPSVAESVIQLENGHAFLASDDAKTNFREMTAVDQFVLESAQECFSSAVQMAFRVAIASGLHPEDGLMLVLAALDEASRSLTKQEAEVDDGS